MFDTFDTIRRTPQHKNRKGNFTMSDTANTNNTTNITNTTNTTNTTIAANTTNVTNVANTANITTAANASNPADTADTAAQADAGRELIEAPHGAQEGIKTKLLAMIQEGADPFEIIYAAVRYLEAASAERGYAQHVIDNIRTIYGTALGEEKPLQDEINELETRRQRIQGYLDATKKDDTVTEDERSRLGFAIKAHQHKIDRLKELLAKAEK